MNEHEKRTQDLKQAEDNLKTFMRSPNGRNVTEYLRVMMNLSSLFDPDSATQTAYNLGANDAIAYLDKLTGNNL